MKTYTFTFIGRFTGGLVDCHMTATRTGVDSEAARLALYDEYEHILVLKCVEVN